MPLEGLDLALIYLVHKENRLENGLDAHFLFINLLESKQGVEGEDFAHFYTAHSACRCWGRSAPKARDTTEVGADVAKH